MLAKMYYQTAPIDVVMQIYWKLALAKAIDSLLTEQEFLEVANEVSQGFYSVLTYDGKTYVVNQFVRDDWEDEEISDDTILLSDIENMKALNYEFYIPSQEEILDFCENGWWTSRESWQELNRWLTDFYLDEKMMESKYPHMMASYFEEEKEYFLEKMYSMDDVVENVKAKMAEVIWFFMSGCEVSETLDQMEELTIPVRQDAKDELIRILEECFEQTNKSIYLGYCKEEDVPCGRGE